MPKYSFALKNGKTLVLDGASQPSDAEVEQHAHDAGVELVPAGGLSHEEFAQLSKADQAAMLRKANDTPLHEPTTFGGGFVKGMRADQGPVVGPWLRNGPDTIASGVDKLKQGRYLGGAADLVKGAGTTVAPLALPYAAVTAPLSLAASTALGTAGSMAGDATARALNADEDTRNAASVAGGIVGGTAGAMVAPSEAAAGTYLSKRATRLTSGTPLEQMARRHGAAAAAGAVGGPKAAAAVEIAQSPAVNRFAGDALRSYADKVQGEALPALPTPALKFAVKPPKAVKAPPTASEQLGVSPDALGATLDSLPNTPAPAGRTSGAPFPQEPMAASLSRADAATDANTALGVSGQATGATMDALPSTPVVDRRISGAPFELEPMLPKVEPPKARSFSDLAEELGLRGRAPDATPDVPEGGPIIPLPDKVPSTSKAPMPSDLRMDDLVDRLGGRPALTLEQLREQLAQELMSREAFRNMGAGSRKRGMPTPE